MVLNVWDAVWSFFQVPLNGVRRMQNSVSNRQLSTTLGILQRMCDAQSMLVVSVVISIVVFTSWFTRPFRLPPATPTGMLVSLMGGQRQCCIRKHAIKITDANAYGEHSVDVFEAVDAANELMTLAQPLGFRVLQTKPMRKSMPGVGSG